MVSQSWASLEEGGPSPRWTDQKN